LNIRHNCCCSKDAVNAGCKVHGLQSGYGESKSIGTEDVSLKQTTNVRYEDRRIITFEKLNTHAKQKPNFL